MSWVAALAVGVTALLSPVLSPATASEPVAESGSSAQAPASGATTTTRPALTDGPAAETLVGPDGELLGMRTRSSQSFRSDRGGAFSTRVFPGPVNYRDRAGSWQRIDPSLRRAAPGAGFDNRAADFDVTVPESAAGRFGVSVEGRSVSYALIAGSIASTATVGTTNGSGSTTSTAPTQGATARYASARPGVDLELTSTTSGLKEALVLAGPDSPAATTFDVALSAGLALRAEPGGGVLVVDEAGRPVFVVAAPFAADSARTPARVGSLALAGADGADGDGDAAAAREGGGVYTDRVSLTIGGTAADPTLTLAVDQGWLRDPARVFPVVVDPTTTPFASSEATYVNSAAASTNYYTAAGTTLKAGGSFRSALYFDVAAALPRDITVMTSDIALRTTAVPTATSLSVHALTNSFSGSAATWQARTSTANWTTPGGDAGPALATNAVSTVGTTVKWLVSGTVAGWVADPASNKGLLLRDATGTGGTVDFAGRSSADAPYLNVNWAPRAGLRSLYTYANQDLTDTTELAVNVATGNLTVSTEDMSLAGPRLGLSVTRTYNSLGAPANGSGLPLPQRWALSFGRDVTIDEYPDGALFTGTSGDPQWFPLASGSGVTAVYTSPAGTDATLKRNATTFAWELQFNNPWLLYTFNGSGLLLSVKDATGNQLQVGYNDTTPTRTSRATVLTDVIGRTQTLGYNTAGLLTSLADGAFAGSAAGSVSYSYDTSNTYLTGSTGRAGEAYGYGYGCTGAAGRLCQITDPRGFLTTITYDTRGRVLSVVRQIDATTTATTSFVYNATTTVVTDSNGHTTTYTFDGNSQVTRVQDPLLHERSRTYNPNGDILTLTSGVGQTTTNTYDGRVGAGGSVSQPAIRGLTSTTLPTGAVASAAYDNALTGPTRAQPTRGTDSQGNTRAFTYNASSGNLQTSKEAGTTGTPTTGGQQLTYAYQGETGVSCNGRPGQLCKVTDGRGKITTYSYDTGGRGELLTVTAPAPLAVQTFGYDAFSRVTSASVVRTPGQAAEVRTFSYDKNNRSLTTTYSDTSSVTLAYDGNGNATSRTEAGPGAAGATTYTYDRLNRLTLKALPDGTSVALAYDRNGNLTSHTDPGGQIGYAYDAANRLIRLVEPGGNCDATPKPDRCTRFEYDNDDRRTATFYPNDVVQRVTYDNSGRQSSVEATGPAGLLERHSYTYTRPTGSTGSPDGNLRSSVTQQVSATDTEGVTTSYGYDPLNRLTSATAHEAQVTGDSPIARWKLDETSGTTAADSTGNNNTGTYATSSLTRGRGGAITGGTSTPAAGGSGGSITTDRAVRSDNPSSTVGPGQVTVGDTPALRLNGPFSIELWVNPAAAPAANTYPGLLNKGFSSFSGSGYEIYYHDNNSNGSPSVHFKTGSIDSLGAADALTVGRWHQITVTYDGLTGGSGALRLYVDGQQTSALTTSIATNTNTSDLLLGRNLNGGGTHTVDDVALYNKALSPQEVERHHRAGTAGAAYTYDLAGNREQHADSHTRTVDPADNTLAYTYNDANQPTSRDGSTTGLFTHDGYGNQTRTQTGLNGATPYAGTVDRATTYNAKNQTLGITNNTATAFGATYTGTSQNERLTTTSTLGGTSTTSTWTNSPLGVTTSRTGAASTLVNYLRDPAGTLIGLRQGTSTNAVRHYYLLDGLGSITGLTDATGNRINTYRYDPYGQALQVTEIVPQPFRYTSGQLDPTTGLTKLGIRYYDPTQGRFTQPDPTGQDDHYTYAGNNPTSYIDPTGAITVGAEVEACAGLCISIALERDERGRNAVALGSSLGTPRVGGGIYSSSGNLKKGLSKEATIVSCALGLAKGSLTRDRGGVGGQAGVGAYVPGCSLGGGTIRRSF